MHRRPKYETLLSVRWVAVFLKVDPILTFTADHHARETVLDLFRSFLKQASKIIREAPSDDVYQMIFDLNGLTVGRG